ncbi:AMP-dependent synthetase/ligase [Gephyromycinifex aptenodytis]|uniref:AMP-dependent synthetase/ligase n=1 Tax=Gephyromycinifex aptenodytis TaxID=2716227 RepID=UPI00144842B3|nr:AMP-dependent synthetase/ligase [Gephyromycinifex aptenodytis]
MYERIVPPLSDPPTNGNLALIPERNARRHPDRVVFSVKNGQDWQSVTAVEFLAQVREVAKGFVAAGVKRGDRVGLMSRTRYEWTLLDFALWTAGAVPVPVYETSSASQVEWILQDSGCVGLIVESSEHLEVAQRARPELPDLRHVWHIDGGAIEHLSMGGAVIDDATLDAATEGMTRADLATIIYTSGTTGRPKGCELTHGNFMNLSDNIVASLSVVVHAPEAAVLLFLPLAHVLARIIEVVVVDAGMRVGHAPDVKNLLPDLQSFRPTFLLAVPRVFEKVYNASDQKATTEGKGRIFRFATRTAIAYSRALDEPGGPSPRLRALHRFCDLLVYRKLRDALGGQVGWAVSGGAPLGPRLGHFYRGIGINILEGYGLTETTAPVAVGRPDALRVGTVGKPLPGCGIRIAEDGEILAHGVGIFRGYRHNPEATAEVLSQDGWLRTGDLGELDADGFLSITGRKKEIIVTAGGKNVAPAMLEDTVRAHPIVSQCVVVGDGRPFIAALLTIDAEMLPSWAKAHDHPDLTPETALTDDLVREHIQMAVDRANSAVSRAESIRDFRLIPGDFTEANGYLTPSMKVRRSAVLKDYEAEIEQIYSGSRTRA